MANPAAIKLASAFWVRHGGFCLISLDWLDECLIIPDLHEIVGDADYLLV